nr:hypothetical protein [Kitasatospora atroaurantiaca]
MRPSYDAEHPSSATPIYDALYSEYRRLFRALPGDRSGEEDLRFAGFAVRDSYASRAESVGYPQQQAFHTYPGHAQGTPQFMPAQQSAGGLGSGGLGSGGQSSGGQFSSGQGWVASGYLSPTSSATSGVGGRHRSMLSLPPGRVPGES